MALDCCRLIAGMEDVMKNTMITLVTVLALASSLMVAQAAGHRERNNHPASAFMNSPTWPGRSWRCEMDRTIPGMGTDNIYGVDNDVNVYRDKWPPC